jgi:protocatechuate 3,4-dioxygenase beta subunit
MDSRATALAMCFAVSAPASAAVTGRVQTTDGAPVAGATVSVHALETFEARIERLAAGEERRALASVKTGADGSFRLEAGSAVVALGMRAEGYAPALVVAEDGETVMIATVPAERRRGTVTGAGRPVAEAILAWAADQSDPQSAEIVVRSGADGGYEVPDPDAWATWAAVTHPDFAPLFASAWRPRLNLELSPGTRVDGQVVDKSSGRGVPGATVSLDRWPRARSAADGTFAITHADAAWAHIAARSPSMAGIGKKAAGRIVIEAQPVRRLAGTIRDSASGRPLAGAIVTASTDSGDARDAVVTDARGQYVLSTLPPGRYWPYAERAGYDAGRPKGMTEPVDLRRATSAAQDIDLEARRRLRGRVVDEQGRPVGGALVSVGLEEAGRFYAAWGPGTDTPVHPSAADGSFDLAQPAFVAQLQKANMQGALVAVKAGYAAGLTRLPPSGDPVTIVLSRGVTLAGRVVRADGAPVSGADIALVEPGPLFAVQGRNQELPAWVRSGADGRFTVQVNPVRVYLAVRKPGHAPRVLDGVDPRAGQPVEVVLAPGAAIRGRVVRSDGRGVADASVFVRDHANPPATAASTSSDSGGAFELTDLVAGAYELGVWHADTAVQAKRTVEAPAADLRVVLGPTAALRGRVVDQAARTPVPRYWITLATRGGAPSDFAAERVEEIVAADGVFVVEDVPTGAVDLIFQAEGYRPRPMENVAVSAEPDGPDLEVALEPGLTVRGRVSSDGAVVADAMVTAGADGTRTDASASTDENGDYELKGLPAGELTLRVSRAGYRSVRRTLDARQEPRADVALTRGLSLSGTVVADETGVPDARVAAASGALDADSQSAVTDAAGRFTLQGLSPGRYTITAASEKGKAELKDLDVATAGPVRLVIDRARAVLTGVVSGLGERPDGSEQLVMVTVKGEGGQAFAPADASGAFRIADAPAGRVAVVAVAMAPGGMRSSETVELTLAAGTETATSLAFKDDLVLTGTVTRLGSAVPNANVAFAAEARGASATTDREGRYEVHVAPGRYRVTVWGDGVSWNAEHAVAESGVFDIDVTGGGLRGRATDAASQAPVPGVEVSLWRVGGGENTPVTSVVSNVEGSFAAPSLREGRYRLVTSKKGFGQQVREVDVPRGGSVDVLVELAPADGITLTVTDGRDGRALDAIVVVRDAARRIVANRHAGADAEGAVTIPLADGAYLVSTSANGYGTATVPVTAPARGLEVALTPGGTLVIETGRPIAGRVRLLQPDGEEYVRCWCDGIAEIKLEGARTTVENVAAGAYTMELVDVPAMSYAKPVVILEGQTTTARIE